ncbi:hypothetical protein DMC30DRAFT_417101 [Rhodotorula diobovata]|uniref:Family A G protein-coupled receptor-like protein n=1 Tax=Rhodotorula diobovata TaxID=5288 RepID=A0A5C5FWB9_9BASI|nr:hypothetical protein DMC30DRAFT_417101 [Rhodotorula diobovata]
MGYTSSLDTNPVQSNIGLSPAGSNWLWALFGIFTLSLLVLLGLAHSRPVHHRAFHYLGIAVLAITAVHYAAQASNLGYASVPVEWIRSGSRGAFQVAGGAPIPPTRSIFYAKWVGYTLTMPILVLMLLLGTGFNLSRIFLALFFTVLWTVCALIGALIPTVYKWAFYAFSTTALLYVLWSIIFPAGRSARTLGREYRRNHIGHAWGLSFLFILYPLVWGLAEGSNVITVSSEMFWDGVLDFLVKVCWLFAFLFGVEGLDYSRFGFHSGKYTDVASDLDGGYGPGRGDMSQAQRITSAGASTTTAPDMGGSPARMGPGPELGGPPPQHMTTGM